MISKNLTRPLALLIFEGALIYSCGVMAIYMRFGAETPGALGAELGWLKTLPAPVLVLASFYLFDLYDLRRIRRLGALLLRLSQSLAVGGMALALMFHLLPQVGPGRGVIPLSLLLTLAFLAARRSMKPGLTGWAQVRYPYGASYEDAREKHQYDLFYIKNQSPMLDALILLETARIVLFGRFSR
jgi:hypothetical protein